MYKCSNCGANDLAPDEFACYQCDTCINCGGCNCEQPPEPDPENEDQDYGQQQL